ncbi:transposable element Tcb2 transposase [Trichonephila clavipes]|nr:transposable element Tcb2 transposase [Trichonephila clavipes]
MQRDCALRIAGRGHLTSFSVENKTARRVSRQLSGSVIVLTQQYSQVARSLEAPVSSRTIRKCLAERHLRSRCPLRLLPLTPTHRCLHLEWSHAQGNWTAVELNQVVFGDESRFNLSSDDNRVRVWFPRGKLLNPAFDLQRYTTPTADVMVWGVIDYNTRSPLVLINGSMTAQQYIHDILQSHVLPLMQRLPGVIFQQDNALPHTARVSYKTASALLLPFFGLSDPQICLQSSISGILWDDGDRFNSCQVIYSQFGLAIHQNDHQARRGFVEWTQNEIAVVPDFHKRILFSDETHFWLNGYVNKQKCRIWSEANPQVYVETPLHPEKLTVWCTLWAGGILLQKR